MHDKIGNIICNSSRDQNSIRRENYVYKEDFKIWIQNIYLKLAYNNKEQSLATKLVVLNISLLEVNFENFTIGLHLLLISSMLAKFQEN